MNKGEGKIEVWYGNEKEEITIKEPPIKIEEGNGIPRFSTFYGGNVMEETGIDYDTLYDKFAQTGDPEDGKKLLAAYDELVGDI